LNEVKASGGVYPRRDKPDGSPTTFPFVRISAGIGFAASSRVRRAFRVLQFLSHFRRLTMMVRTFLAQLVLLAACTAALLAQGQPDGKKNLFQEYVEKFGPPGPEHKLLEPLFGTWHAEVKTWMEPNQSPQLSNGTLLRKSILDGRFVQEDYQGKMLDKPFHGIGTLGFDRAKGKYVTTWIDSISTAIQMSRGDYDQSARTWTFKHEDDCPITGKRVKMRDTLRIVSPNEQQMEMYRQLGDEKEMKMMEIRLTREK
jgi:hypothetical protein